MGGDVSLYGIYVDNDTANTHNGDFFTFGARHVGKLAGLDYRVEAYKQVGTGGGAYAEGSSLATAFTGAVDFDAEMFGIRVGKTFKNVQWSPTVTLWYDYLSGTDDDDVADGDWGTFHTLFDTGHKFYGLIDNYLSAQGDNTANLGLQDVAIKFKIKPRENWVAKMDLHHFMTAVNPGGNVAVHSAVAGLTSASDNDFGQEIDLTVAHQYSSNIKITGGYSHYWATQTFGDVQARALNTGSNDADWFYVNGSVNF
jgi:hypothetical protein